MAETMVLREVAAGIAAYLDGFRVIVGRDDYDRPFSGWLWLVHTDGRRLWVQLDPTGRRLVIAAEHPAPGGGRGDWPEISLRMDRDPQQLAADIARRLLPRYGRLLAKRRAEQAQQAQQEARQMAVAKRVAALIPGAQVHSYTQGRTVVFWSSGSSSHPGARGIGSGELEFLSGDEVVLKIRWLPVAVVERLAAALASSSERSPATGQQPDGQRAAAAKH